jgi:hypothetical protein
VTTLKIEPLRPRRKLYLKASWFKIQNITSIILTGENRRICLDAAAGCFTQLRDDRSSYGIFILA